MLTRSSAAVATSREGHRLPGSGREGQHRRWERELVRGIGSDDARKVARGRIVVMEESRHKKSLENRREIKEAQCPGARA